MATLSSLVWSPAWCVALAIALGTTSPRDPAAPAQVAASATITGRVVEARTMLPLRRARIVGQQGSAAHALAASDANGRFQLTGLTPGVYRVTVSRTGYAPSAAGRNGASLTVGATGSVDAGTIALVRAAVISGSLRDERGRPLVGASVAARIDRADGLGPVAARAAADDLGNYRLWGLPPGSYIVEATSASDSMAASSEPAESFYPGVASGVSAGVLALGEGEQADQVSFVVRRYARAAISGTVVDPDGRPVPSGRVTVWAVDTATRRRVQAATLPIRVGGEFRTSALPPGLYEVAAVASSQARSQGPIVQVPLTGEPHAGLVLVLPESQPRN